MRVSCCFFEGRCGGVGEVGGLGVFLSKFVGRVGLFSGVSRGFAILLSML